MPGLHIIDGTGSNKAAAVSAVGNRLDVSSRSNPRIYYISRNQERAFSVYSEDDDAAAGDFIFYFKNTSTTRRWVVEDIMVASENAATFKLHVVTGTASGSEITPTNLNLGSPNTSESSAFGNAAVGGLTSSATLEALRTAANTTERFAIKDSLQLLNGDAIAVEYDTGTTGDAEVAMIGFFETE